MRFRSSFAQTKTRCKCLLFFKVLEQPFHQPNCQFRLYIPLKPVNLSSCPTIAGWTWPLAPFQLHFLLLLQISMSTVFGHWPWSLVSFLLLPLMMTAHLGNASVLCRTLFYPALESTTFNHILCFFFILQAAPGKSSVQMILDLSILLRALTHCVNSLSFISEEQSNQAGDKAREADLYSSTSGTGTKCNLSRLALIYFCCCCWVKSLSKSFYMRTAHRGLSV